MIPSDAPMATRPPEEQPITEEYQPQLTPAGKSHPLFRFSADEAVSASIWGNFKPLYWYAKGYRKKPLTNVLAVHPTKSAESGAPGEKHPLVIQQFAGAGPVLFFGFDDTWRWRSPRADEEHFDHFWMQAMRKSIIAIAHPTAGGSYSTSAKNRVPPQTRGDNRAGSFPNRSLRTRRQRPVRVSITRTPLTERRRHSCQRGHNRNRNARAEPRFRTDGAIRGDARPRRKASTVSR